MANPAGGHGPCWSIYLPGAGDALTQLRAGAAVSLPQRLELCSQVYAKGESAKWLLDPYDPAAEQTAIVQILWSRGWLALR